MDWICPAVADVAAVVVLVVVWAEDGHGVSGETGADCHVQDCYAGCEKGEIGVFVHAEGGILGDLGSY